MPERLGPSDVVDVALGVLGNWFNGSYCHPFGENGPQFKVVEQGDGTFRFVPPPAYTDPAIHPDDTDGAVFTIDIVVARVR
jgi:hypothetical protein